MGFKSAAIEAALRRYTAVLDACVLFPRLHRDILLSIAHADLYTARWSAEIEKEWTTNYKKKYPDAEINRLVDFMRQAVPDALIVGYEEFIPATNKVSKQSECPFV